MVNMKTRLAIEGRFEDPSSLIFPVEEENIQIYTETGVLAVLAGNVYALDPPGTNLKNPAEALTLAVREGGDDRLKNVDGDFTFFLITKEELKIYRDFKGAGPQVFYNREGFSTRPEKLSGEAKPDLQALAFYLKYGFLPADRSGIEGLRRIPPGTLLIRDLKSGKEILRDTLREMLEEKNEPFGDEKEWIRQYSELHSQAVRRRTDQAKSISLLLSGGYDSGGNLAALREVYKGKINAYTVSFRDNPLSELPQVKVMSEHFGADLHNYEISGDEIDNLPEIVKTTGVPFQESGLMINFSVMRRVSADDPGMVLGGDGNDQFFGTGGTELGLNHFFRITGILILLRILRTLSSGFNSSFFKKIGFYVDKIDGIHKPDHWGFNDGDLSVKTESKSYFPSFRSFSLDASINHRRKHVDIPVTISEVILFKASRMAELFGVRLSFPYLTPELFRFLNSLPRQMRIRGSLRELARGRGTGKFLHKALYRDKIPKSVAGRKKQGGFVPLSVFFTDAEKNVRMLDMLSRSALLGKLLKDRDQAVIDMKAFLENPDPWFWQQQVMYSRMLNMLVLVTWEDVFIKKRDRKTLLED